MIDHSTEHATTPHGPAIFENSHRNSVKLCIVPKFSLQAQTTLLMTNAQCAEGIVPS